jgi:Zn-dependent protease
LRRAHRSLQRRRRRQTESIEIPLALELDSFHWMESRQMPPLGRRVKFWLLAGSLTLFILSCIQFLSPVNIAIFVGVLLLHECGHLAAMKWRGYRHHIMLFIPWLGAMVTGEKDDATVVDKTIVALSGPLPGLLLGCGLGWWTQELTNPDWLNMAIEMLIWLNALNLLPLHPLDGGQVIDVLLCSRYPYLDLAFKLGGIAFSLVVAIHQPILQPIAWLFILTIAFSIPDSFHIARLNRRLQSRLDRRLRTQLDREVLLNEIFTVLHRSGGHKLASSRRYLLTKKLLQRHHESGTSGLARLGLGTFYSLSLMTGLWGGSIALSSEFRRNNDFGEDSDRHSQVKVQNLEIDHRDRSSHPD